MPMTETKRELFKAAQHYVHMAKRIRETGILSPEDAADIAEALAFLHGCVAMQETDARQY